MEGTSIDADKSRRSLLKELPYFSCGGDLSMIHGQSNNSFVTLCKTRRNLDKLSSIYDLDLFNLNTRIYYNLSPSGQSHMRIHSRYFSPHSFRDMKTKQLEDDIETTFSVFHNNVVSLNRNLENLQTHLLYELDFHFNVIGVTETKITNSNLHTCNANIPGYVFECVPTPLASGGVGLFIDETLSYSVLGKISNEAFQSLWIEITFVKKKSVICGVLYRQHNSPNRFQQYFDETIEKFTSSRKHVVIMGDFNIDLLKCDSSSYSHDFISSLQSCYLIPTIDKPTRVRSSSATLIDNIFLNNPDQVVTCGNIVSDISDHFSQFCVLKSVKDKVKVNKFKVRNFSRFSADCFNTEVSQVDWKAIVEKNSCDVNNLFSSFYNKFNKLVNNHAPMKIISNRKAKQLSKPWITQGLRTSIKIKNKLYASGDVSKYKTYRNKICSLARISKQQYYFNFFDSNLTNMKKTWEGINSILAHKSKRSKTITSIKDPSDSEKVTRDPLNIANVLNKHFASVGPTLANNLPSAKRHFGDFLKTTKSPQSSFAFNLVTPEEVRSEISCIPKNKSHGLYSCPTPLLKCSSNVISGILADILNISISTGVYPSKLKMAKIIPIFKQDDDTDANNYRPISLLSNFNRIFEKIVFKRMESFIEQKNLLTPSQYGFRKAHSTQHAILDIVNAIQTNMDNRVFSCGIFIDLKKAFDTVDHKILLHKLDHYGFRGHINIWLSSYLQGRSQTTQFGPHISKRLDSTCGVPQGSVLGPLLFLLYINDIQESSDKFSFYLFADDTNILYSDKNLKSLELSVNQELNNVYDWLTANKLTLNIKKSNFVIFCPPQRKLTHQPRIVIFDSNQNKKVALEHKDYVKHLGILIDKNLSWKHHIDYIAIKVSRTVGLITKLRHFLPTHTLLNIYHALVTPYLTYGLAIWGQACKSYLDKLLKLQKRALRFIFFADYSEHAIPLFLDAQVLPIKFLYYESIANLMFDVRNTSAPSNIQDLFQDISNVHSYNTRSSTSNNFYTKPSRLSVLANSFSRIGVKVWNEIPQALRDLSKNAFKRKLKQILFNILGSQDSYIDLSQIIKNVKSW